MSIVEGQLRWVQMYSSIGDTPPYHLSFEGRYAVCGKGLYDGAEINRYENALGLDVPEPPCIECQAAMRASLGLADPRR
jgi:hypothetical protein